MSTWRPPCSQHQCSPYYGVKRLFCINFVKALSSEFSVETFKCQALFLKAQQPLVICSESECVIHNSLQEWSSLAWRDLQAMTRSWGEKTSKTLQYGELNVARIPFQARRDASLKVRMREGVWVRDDSERGTAGGGASGPPEEPTDQSPQQKESPDLLLPCRGHFSFYITWVSSTQHIWQRTFKYLSSCPYIRVFLLPHCRNFSLKQTETMPKKPTTNQNEDLWSPVPTDTATKHSHLRPREQCRRGELKYC